MSRKINHKAIFNLRNQNSFFGGWPVIKDTVTEYAIVISFPVEGWKESAAVRIAQRDNGDLFADCYGATTDAEKAIDQAVACLSLDVDDADWENVGQQDKIIGKLQNKYDYLRPVLFHSPYEAAVGFIIGQRISVKQRQAIQKNIAEHHGEKNIIEDTEYFAFPSPQNLLRIQEFAGLSKSRIERLHGIAKAALEGSLDRAYLLNMPVDAALAYLQTYDGLGPFYASGILYRGAGIVDSVTDDSLTKYALKQAYNLQNEPTQTDVIKLAENWRPYRMWAEVLIHVWLRREVGLPKRK